MSKFLKKDDRVIVISGNDKGKVGTVLSRKENRILVQGVNIRKKHMKRRSQEAQSEIISIEVPIHISNVRPCSADGKPVKLKSRVTAEGAKELYFVEGSNETIYRTLRKAKK